MTRSCEVWRIALRDDAIVGKAQCFARVPPGLVGPDGLAMDRHDRLYIANPGHGCVWIVDPHGVPLYRVRSEHGRMTTNCALAPDGRTLFITESETGNDPGRGHPGRDDMKGTPIHERIRFHLRCRPARRVADRQNPHDHR